ncbi:MAG: hypothetical protein AMXMBFR7_22670 [Planctomycetota bacterium]
MMRSVGAGCGLFVLVALAWTFYDPLASLNDVARLGAADADAEALERTLEARGRGALWALREGMSAPNPAVRLRCAGLLARLNAPEAAHAERLLLETLARGERDPQGALAERLLLDVWDRRGAPDDDARLRELRRGAQTDTPDAETRRELDLLIGVHPFWLGGYTARSRYHFTRGAWLLAAQDALQALVLEPNHFEALATRGRCLLRLGYPEQALQCLEQATRVHPRLMSELEADLERSRKEAAVEREERLRQRRMERPLS